MNQVNGCLRLMKKYKCRKSRDTVPVRTYYLKDLALKDGGKLLPGAPRDRADFMSDRS